MFSKKVFEKYGPFYEARHSADAEIIERILFFETGLKFNKESYNAHTFCMMTDCIPGINNRSNNILVINQNKNKNH